MDKIKVLHVVGRMDRGGTEALLMSLLRILDKSKFQFDIVEQTNDVCEYDQEILSLGSKIYRCPHISLVNLKQYRAWWRRFFVEHPEYKIVHGHSRGSASIYLDEANKANRITILHCHNNSYGKGISGAIRYIWQLPLHHIADYNFACSYDSGVSQFGKNSEFTVIKNGIITSRFDWSPETREDLRNVLNLKGQFVVGNVARFIEQKNHNFLIDVFYEIVKIRESSKLLLIGEGPYVKRIQDKIQSLGLEDKVIFTGIRDDVERYYQAMDVFVLPSLFEGFGIVNIEAQTSGLPCFVSDKVVPSEVNVTDLMHYIPLSFNAKEWAEIIIQETSALSNRRSRRNEIIESGYDITSTLQQLVDFYSEVSRDV